LKNENQKGERSTFAQFLLIPPEFPDCAAEDACAYIRDLSTRYLVLNPAEALRLPVR
jgi:hypothetical protein